MNGSFALLCAVLLVGAPSRGDDAHVLPGDALSPVAQLESRIAVTRSFTCHRRMLRYSERGPNVRRYDAVDLNVSVLGSAEAYSEIISEDSVSLRRKQYRKITDLPQAWFTGELVSMAAVLRQEMLRNSELPPQAALVNGLPALLYEFHVPASALEWNVQLRSRSYPLAFTLRAWFSSTTGDLLKSVWSAADSPTLAAHGIQAIVWSTRFRPATIAGVTQALPDDSTFQVFYSGKQWRVDWIDSTFTDFRRYGSQSDVHFE